MRTFANYTHRVAREYVGKRYLPDAKPQRDLLVRLLNGFDDRNVFLTNTQGSWIRNGVTQDQAELEGLFLIIAGSDTTASTLRITLLHIMTCPRVYNKLKQEIRDAVIDGKVASPIQFEESKRLPYLQVGS